MFDFLGVMDYYMLGGYGLLYWGLWLWIIICWGVMDYYKNKKDDFYNKFGWNIIFGGGGSEQFLE